MLPCGERGCAEASNTGYLARATLSGRSQDEGEVEHPPAGGGSMQLGLPLLSPPLLCTDQKGHLV